jgi:hypothetical protein
VKQLGREVQRSANSIYMTVSTGNVTHNTTNKYGYDTRNICFF